MASPLLVGIAVSVIIYWICEFIKARPKNFPPGPTRIPFFGNYLHVLFKNFREIYKEITTWTKKYNSKVVSFFVGSTKSIVVGDYDTVKEVLLRPEFDGRPFPYSAAIRTWEKRFGIFFTEQDFWLEQRRFTLRFLRDYGFGRRQQKLEHIIEDETKEMLKLIENGPQSDKDKGLVRKGRMFFVPDFFSPPFINAYITVLIGHPLSREIRDYIQNAGKSSMMFNLSTDSTGGILSIFPWIRYIFPKLSGYHGIYNGHHKLLDFIKVILEERKKYVNEESEGFMDYYLKEMKLRAEKDGSQTSFTEDQLWATSADFLMPAASAVGVTLSLLIERLIHNPQIQDKMYEEIVQVVGTGRLPTLDDRPNLSYCEATLREGMRCDTSVPLGLPHSTLTDTTLQGYQIPKDTVVLTNLWQMHHDEKIWGDPFNFRPERFLDSNGKLSLKLDKSLPFGLGRRVCAGETFARNTMFLYITGLVQHYKFTVEPGKPLPNLNNRISMLLMTMKDYWVKCIPRD